MGLKDQIKELEGKISEEEKVVGSDDTQAEEPPQDDAAADDDKADDADENQGEDDGQAGDDEKKAEEENHAKARVDARREQGRIDALEKELAALKAEKAKPPSTEEAQVSPEKAKTFEEFKKAKGVNDPEPNKAEDYEAWLEWKDREIERKQDWTDVKLDRIEQDRVQRSRSEQQSKDLQEASRELGTFIRDFMAEKQDAKEVYDHLEKSIGNSMKLMYPQMNAVQVQQAVNMKILQLAGTFAQRGQNPAEALYDLGLNNGYVAPRPENKGEEKPSKADLEKIAAAKKRSASAAAGGRSAAAGVSIDEFQNMSIAQRAKLSKEQIAELLANAD